MYTTSLTAQESLDPTLFPLLQIRNCISEATQSLNGPRYCAQDRLTGCVFEVHSCKVDLEGLTTTSAEGTKKILTQQRRIDELLRADVSGISHYVCLPIDVYLQEQGVTGETYIASVEPYCGMSLGDLIRSGWNIVEESVFKSLLRTIEVYGCSAARLPTHGNISPDAIKQLMTVRDSATEEQHISRWVVGDWKLLYTDDNEEKNGNTIVGDLEWLLYSSFSELKVASEQTGSFLSMEVIESMMNGVVERIRAALWQSSAGVGDRLGDLPNREDEGSLVNAIRAARASSDPSSEVPSEIQQAERAAVAARLQEAKAAMSVQEKISYHQNALRAEQNTVNRYRRKNEPLPPLPQSAAAAAHNPTDIDAGDANTVQGGHNSNSPNRIEYTGENEEYELQYLTSPIKPRPSRFLVQRGSTSSITARPVVKRRSEQVEISEPLQAMTSSNAFLSEKERILDNVVDLAVLNRDRRTQELREQQDEMRMRREALRALMMRNAAKEANSPRGKHKTPRKETTAPATAAANTTPRATAAKEGKDRAAAKQTPKSPPQPSLSPAMTAGGSSPDPKPPQGFHRSLQDDVVHTHNKAPVREKEKRVAPAPKQRRQLVTTGTGGAAPSGATPATNNNKGEPVLGKMIDVSEGQEVKPSPLYPQFIERGVQLTANKTEEDLPATQASNATEDENASPAEPPAMPVIKPLPLGSLTAAAGATAGEKKNTPSGRKQSARTKVTPRTNAQPTRPWSPGPARARPDKKLTPRTEQLAQPKGLGTPGRKTAPKTATPTATTRAPAPTTTHTKISSAYLSPRLNKDKERRKLPEPTPTTTTTTAAAAVVPSSSSTPSPRPASGRRKVSETTGTPRGTTPRGNNTAPVKKAATPRDHPTVLRTPKGAAVHKASAVPAGVSSPGPSPRGPRVVRQVVQPGRLAREERTPEQLHPTAANRVEVAPRPGTTTTTTTTSAPTPEKEKPRKKVAAPGTRSSQTPRGTRMSEGKGDGATDRDKALRRTRSADIVKRSDVKPVHEASVGISTRVMYSAATTTRPAKSSKSKKK